jgi:hypothetical protein
VGEKSYESESITMTVGEKTVNGAELSHRNSVPVRMGIPLIVTVAGDKLAEGIHTVNIVATTSEIGPIKFDINDSLN